MKKIFRTFRILYSESTGIHFIAMALFILSLTWYRFETYFIIRDVYREMGNLSYPDYISMYTRSDSVTLLYVCLFLLPLLMISGRFTRIRIFLASLLVILFTLVLMTGIEFFKVYETSLQYGHIEGELSTGLGSLLKTVVSELSAGFYLRLLAVLTATPLALTLIHGSFQSFMAAGGGRIRKGMVLYPPSLIAALMCLTLLTDSDAVSRRMAQKYLGSGTGSRIHELSINPIYSLFSGREKSGQGEITRPAESPDQFLKSLDTSSLVSARTHSRINLIPRKRYNIILYFFESFSYEYLDMKINGRYVTPTWHRLGENSLKARNHYANFPLSANAMLSVFTSKYDSTNDDLIIEKYPDIRMKTVSEILSEQGYRTCLIHTGGLGYVGQKRFLKNRKFDRILEAGDLMKITPYKKVIGWGIDERAMIRPSVDFMKEDAGRPFLMVYLPVNPHHPYIIPDESFRITGKYAGDSAENRGKWLDYLNSLHYSDQVLGMLIDELERERLAEETLIFIFADHGEAFFQHRGNYSHRRYIYEENTHVPFIIYNKKIFRQPYEYHGISRHIDILPTILDALKISQPGSLEGTSMISAHREQLAFLHTNWHDDFYGLRDGNWKYIMRKSDRFEELYDLAADPKERKNMARERADILELFRGYVSKATSYKQNFYRGILY